MSVNQIQKEKQEKQKNVEIKQHATKKKGSIKKSKRKSENTLRQAKKQKNKKHNFPKPMGQRKSRSKRKVHNNTGLPQETKISKNHLTYHLREKEQTKPKVRTEEDTIITN